MTTPPIPTLLTSPHPAKFSDSVLENASFFINAGWRVLDPFAGVGRIHEITKADTWGIEIEPEWASAHPRTLVGSALHLPFRDASFDCIFTSPTYGNRLADHHDAKEKCKTCEGDGEVAENFSIYSTGMPDIVPCPKCNGTGHNSYKRMTYRHQLGRALHPDNSGQLQWGPKYQNFHTVAWEEAIRVLKPGGSFILNISDHIRAGKVIAVADWHKHFFIAHPHMKYVGKLDVPTPRMRFGANSELRVDSEVIYLFAKLSLHPRWARDRMSIAEPSPASTGPHTQGEQVSDTFVVDDASTEAPEVTDGTDAAGADTNAPTKDRRPRGWLEVDVKKVTDQFVTGEIKVENGQFLTPHRISRLVQSLDSLPEPPSTGAVSAVLNRWVKLGFAQTNDKPYAFVDYTQAGREHGLTALKAQRSAALKQERAAAKATSNSDESSADVGSGDSAENLETSESSSDSRETSF